MLLRAYLRARGGGDSVCDLRAQWMSVEPCQKASAPTDQVPRQMLVLLTGLIRSRELSEA